MILKYYLEIKNRFLLLNVTWISTILISYLYKETLLFICIKPSLYNNDNIYFIFTDIKEIFSVYISLIFFFSNQILFFYTIFHILSFISLGLYNSEYTFLKLGFFLSLFFWGLSLFFFNKIFFPISFNFFLSFQLLTFFQFFNFHFEAKLIEYFNYYRTFYYISIFYFQMFVVLVFLLNYININLIFIKRLRKLLYFFFIIFSTLISPPDIFSQILFSCFLIGIYELSVFSNIFFINIKKVSLVAS